MFTTFSKEEFDHGEKLIKYLCLRGGNLNLCDIKAPGNVKWTIPKALCASIDLEKQVTEVGILLFIC